MILMTIFILLVFALFMFMGYRKGLVRTVLGFFVVVLPFLLAYLLAPIVTDVVIDRTRIDDYFSEKIEDKIHNVVKQKVENEMQANFGIVDDNLCEQYTQQALNTPLSKVEEIEFIQKLHLPQFASGALLENDTVEVREKLNANSFYEYISIYVTRMIMRALVFGCLYIFLWLVLRIIMLIIILAVRMPMLSTANRIAGMMLGLLEALFIVWVFFAFVAVFANTDFGERLESSIQSSSFLKFLFDKNIIMDVITGIKNAI